MIVICLRALILYIVVFLVIRIMGKKEMAKVQPFELAIIIVIADLASSPMSDRGISIFDGIVPIITLLMSYIIFTCIMKSSTKAEEVICGKHILIIEDGKLLEREMKKQNYTVSDVMAQLRNNNVFKVQDVKFAIVETNGDLNIIKFKDKMERLPMNIIEDGEINDNSRELLHMSVDDVKEIVKKENVEINKILIGTVDEYGKFMYQKKEDLIKWKILWF